MDNVVEGKFGSDSITTGPDESKKYICYYCEEIIHYALPSENIIKALKDSSPILGPQWRHTVTGKVMCDTPATPSNMEAIETI